jgi:Ca-activated chloride channel family protein
MSLSWPWALLALLAVPLVVVAWWWTRHRHRRGAVRVTSIALVRASLPGRNRWRRLIPAALLLLGLAVLGVGAARPHATVQVPSSSGTIMLALDVSGSMCSTDVSPNRITAAERAASAFIRSEAGGPRIGLVPFAGTAGVLVPPTADSGALLHALGGLATSQGTAIGHGILTSLDAIAQVDPSVAPTGARPARARGYAHDVIVVLTDGSNNVGVPPRTAARQAAARGVRVFTIGFGTTNPAPLVCGNSQFGGFSGGGYAGPSGMHNPLVADYGALRQIAGITGGKFYRAQNANQLKAALGNLSGTFTSIREHLDIAAWFAGFGGLVIAAALALSLYWNRTRRPSGRPTGPEASPGR